MAPRGRDGRVVRSAVMSDSDQGPTPWSPEQRRSASRLGPNVHWESWSLNGEVCITGLDPPFAGGARLGSCLTWLIRSVASRCRSIHNATGEVAFAYTGPGTPSPVAAVMPISFDLALRSPRLISARVRQRGGVAAGGRWPSLWLEGSAYEYVIGRDPLPAAGTLRRGILLLAEERHVFVPARAAPLAPRVQRTWAQGLDAVHHVDTNVVAQLLVDDEKAFFVNLFALVHEARAPRPRPSLEESYRRHEGIISELAPWADAKALRVAWHALWRLPPAMTCEAPSAKPWMRYPAVSFVAAVRPLP